MAYLNVREKRIEAKIAYVGGALSGKRTTFAELRKRRDVSTDNVVNEETSLALSVRPIANLPLLDCELVVKLVGHRGAPATDAVASLVDDADGVVVIVEAAPTALEKNRQSIQAVREALGARSVPVVVQINKTDLEGAVPADEVLRGLGVDAWSHVAASASSGDGVEETFNRVVHDVMESMTQSDSNEDGNRTSTDTRRGEGNPLLTALRRVLETTVEQHVRRLGDDLATRIEQRLDARVDALAQRLEVLERGHAALIAASRSAATREDVQGAVGSMRELAASTERQVASIRDRFEVVESGTEAFRHHLLTSSDELLRAARHTCTREDLATATTDLRNDVVRAVDSGVAASRESAAAVAALRRTVDALAVDLKKAGGNKEAFAPVMAKLDELEQRTKVIATAVEGSAAPLASIAKLGTTVKEGNDAVARELRDSIPRRIAALDLAIREVAANAETAAASTQERTAHVETLLTELVEELKKPKKGWFG